MPAEISSQDGFIAPKAFRRTRVIPGFTMSLGITIFFVSVIVIIPLLALLMRPWENGFSGFIDTLFDKRVFAALKISFLCSLLAALVNLFVGVLIAWVLVRYDFPGKRLVDAFIDMPFALPTAVSGIALSAIYAPNGWIGGFFDDFGIKIAYSPIGIFIALVFIGLPFIVRSVQPVLSELEAEVEEAAETLGASPLQTFNHVILPAIMPALLSGFSLAFARGMGEYGSVIFIAGNIPYVSEIAPLLIVVKLEEYDYAGAASVGIGMLIISFVILFALNLTQRYFAKKGL